jgi:all-trans-retinol 13,14-reductase
MLAILPSRVITPEVDFRIPLGWENFRTRLLETFPEESGAINRYCDTIKSLHQQICNLQQEIRWFEQGWSKWLKLPKYWELFSHRHWTLQNLYDQVGLSPKLQALLAGQSGDYGLPPREIALITHTSLVSDYAQGAYYPRYHFQHLVNTITEAITTGGGQILYSTPVEHIEVQHGQIQYLQAGQKTYQATQAYISDLDPKLTVNLLHEGAKFLSPSEYQRLTSYEYSASAFNIYLGLEQRFAPHDYGLGNWNIWYYPSSNINQAYQQQLEGNLEHPWIFLSCPTLKSREPGMAPLGHHVLEITTPKFLTN